jgi:hypothetical protein
MEKYLECHYSQIHMNPKMEYDIFSIFLQLVTFGHCGKSKTILKLIGLSD